MECTKVTTGVKKAKKKQVKDGIDRIKQAEKKKRRLEKALATSAAICSELEKKKQKKKEEQERLDEEGAAIAESVALHVLLGESDSDISNKVMLKNNPGFYNDSLNYSFENFGWVSDVRNYEHDLNHYGNSNFMVSSDPVNGHFYPRCFGDEGWGSVGLSADYLAAQAVSSLKIADDARVDAAYVFNHIY